MRKTILRCILSFGSTYNCWLRFQFQNFISPWVSDRRSFHLLLVPLLIYVIILSFRLDITSALMFFLFLFIYMHASLNFSLLFPRHSWLNTKNTTFKKGQNLKKASMNSESSYLFFLELSNFKVIQETLNGWQYNFSQNNKTDRRYVTGPTCKRKVIQPAIHKIRSHNFNRSYFISFVFY